MLKIGYLQLPSRCMLAPMAGITDLPFRRLNRAFGCSFAFTEMVSVRALTHGGANTKDILSTEPHDVPLGVQLLGSDSDAMQKALELLQRHSPALIDLNAACPVPKITKKGKGASLLKTPHKLQELLKVMVRYSEVPVTVKIRSGWDESSTNAVDVARHAQDAGIHGLFIHGRTREQGYRGRVDYRIIKEVKTALQIPVIASGDALSPYLIKKMFDETGCDGVAIARGALGNPWIFRQAKEFMERGNLPERPSGEEVATTMKLHLQLFCDFYGEKHGTMLFRKFFGWYATGIPHMNLLRDMAFRAATRERMTELIECLLANYPMV